MKSISPIVPALKDLEVILAEKQPPYMPLAVLPVDDGQYLISRWRFSWRERLSVLFTGDLYLWVWNFKRPMQPVSLQVTKPEVGRKS